MVDAPLHAGRCKKALVYGITINDTLLRFWHNDRSAVVASQIFDFIKVILVLTFGHLLLFR